MRQKYNVVIGPSENDKAPYGGWFGYADWSPGSCSRPWHFTSIPETGCCGFGLVDKHPSLYFTVETIEAFLKQAHFSGFIIDQPLNNRFDPDRELGKTACVEINAKHGKIFTLHHFTLEANLQLFTTEIHDLPAFYEWRES